MVITNNIITITMWCKDGCFNKLLLLYNNNDNNNNIIIEGSEIPGFMGLVEKRYDKERNGRTDTCARTGTTN